MKDIVAISVRRAFMEPYLAFVKARSATGLGLPRFVERRESEDKPITERTGFMEKLMEFIKKKSHIEYDMNSIEKYIQGGDFDGSLKKTWDGLKRSSKMLNAKSPCSAIPKPRKLKRRNYSLWMKSAVMRLK